MSCPTWRGKPYLRAFNSIRDAFEGAVRGRSGDVRLVAVPFEGLATPPVGWCEQWWTLQINTNGSGHPFKSPNSKALMASKVNDPWSHWELRRWLTKILLWRPFVPGSSHLTLTLATGSLQLERRSVFFVQCTGSEILWQKRKLMYLLIQVTPYALLIANTSCWFGTSRGNLVIGYCNHLILK